jgi:hypothetical protein
MMPKCLKWWGVFFMGLLLLCCFCSKKKEEEKLFAKVYRKKIPHTSFNSFDNMRYMYPATSSSDLYPGRRSSATLCVETAAFYKKAKSLKRSIETSDDWKWKKIFFPGQKYIMKVLDKNMGLTKEEIEEYYEKNKDQYIDTIKVKVIPDSTDSSVASSDASSSKDTTSQEVFKDSIGQLSLFAVRSMIIKEMFLTRNPPDSEYYAKSAIKVDTAGDTTVAEIDSTQVQDEWYQRIRRNTTDFFMKTMYKKKYGKKFPDSVAGLVGEGKPLSQTDLDVILNWLPENRREGYKDPGKQLFLASWLIKWKLFSEEAEKTGALEKDEMQGIIDWALKFQTVLTYINGPLLEKIEESITVDTMMCIYEYWDSKGEEGIYPDSAQLSEFVTAKKRFITKVALGKEIYTTRQKAKVAFLQPDFKDDKSDDPLKLAAEADSLYGAGKANEAERIYRKLVDNFPFDSTGENAHIELAKIMTEKAGYFDAVRKYREFLQISTKEEKRCNIFFMIGFIYGENLNKPKLAELNYKWILKNTPECELADDAEFMCLHLDEPMIGVEELQAEAKRQGRKVEEEGEVDNKS